MPITYRHQALASSLPPVSARTWLATVLFLASLLILFSVSLAAIGWWRRRVFATEDAARKVARNASVPFAIQLLTRAIDFGFVALLYRFVQQNAIGAYEFAGLLVVQYLGTFADWGLTVLTTRDVARDHTQAPLYFRTTLRLRVRFTLLSIPLAALVILSYNSFAAAGIIANGLDSRTITLIAVLVLTLLPTALSSAGTALFQATERLEVPAFINLLTNIGSAALRVGALALGFGIVGVAVGALLGAIIGAALFGWALHRLFDSALTLTGPTLPARSLLNEGWPLLLNSLLIGVFFRFDVFIINAFQGEATVAIYNTAYKYINLTQILPPIVVNAVFPLLSRRAASDRDGMRRAYAGTLRLLLLIAFPVAMGFSVLATPLIGGLSGAEYLPGGAWALALTIWYLPLSFVNGLTQYVVIALGRQRSITLAFGLTAVFNLLMNVLLVPRYGFIASALITIASELVLFLPLRRVLIAEGVAPQLGALMLRPWWAAIGMGVTMALAASIHLIVALVVALPVYAALLSAFGTFTAADRHLLARVLRRG